MLTDHKRNAPSGAGYLSWSVLGGAAAIHVPWSDILGRQHTLTPEVRDRLLARLEKFERDLSARQPNDTLPPLPTPHARLVATDDTAFHEELARRLVDYLAIQDSQVTEVPEAETPENQAPQGHQL